MEVKTKFKDGSEGAGDLLNFISSITFLRNLLSPTREKAQDRPKDSQGKIDVDVTNPHILENMDYFRKAAKAYEKTGKYTEAYPSRDPNSPYRKFWDEEKRRCIHGYVRSKDGEWVTGYHYYYLNYSPILKSEVIGERTEDGSVRADRVEGFPDMWDGDYLFFHYIEQAEASGEYASVLKARGKGYSFKAASMLIRNYELFGKSKSYAFAGDTEYLDTDGILNKAWSYLDFANKHVGFAKKLRLKDSMMEKRSGYKKPGDPVEYGMLSSVIGVTMKNNPGKAHPYSETVYTPEGKKLWKDIKVGSKLFDTYGGTCTVTDIPYDGTRDIYEIEFADGRKVQASDHHEFEVYSHNSHKGYTAKRVETIDIAAAYSLGRPGPTSRMAIKVADKGVEYNRQDVPIDAYTLGLLLGDGTFRGAKCNDIQIDFTKSHEDLKELKQYVPYTIEHKNWGNANRNSIRIPQGRTILKGLGLYNTLSGGKFIPDVYKYNTKEVRFDILNGLLDTDGSVTKDFGVIEYSSKSERMSQDVLDILYSLGFGAKRTSKVVKGTVYYRVYVYCHPDETRLFKQTRKRELIKLKSQSTLSKFKRNYNQIVKVTKLPKAKCKCVTVDSANHMYLIASNTSTFNSRGKRGKLIVWEESGIFPNILKSWRIAQKSLEDGNRVFGLMVAFGTGGEKGANFEGLEALFYKPKAYRVRANENVYDKNTSKQKCGFFVPDYLNRADCYDKNGNSDVIQALEEIISGRLKIKYSGVGGDDLAQAIAEEAITPQEAVMRTEGTVFPIEELKNYLAEIAPNIETFTSTHYTGSLYFTDSNSVEFKPDFSKVPLREYPIQKSDTVGAVELFEMPKTGGAAVPPWGRYIGGADTVDDEYGTSLFCVQIMDLFTDKIVAEWTGRYRTANENFKVAHMLAIFYNAEINYENKLKGMFAYFDKKSALRYLCDTPEILSDMDYVAKKETYGNKKKGTPPTNTINMWGRRLQADYMLTTNEHSEVIGYRTIRSLGYIRECISWNLLGNFDRVSAGNMLFILREDRRKFIENKEANEAPDIDDYENDEFFMEDSLDYAMEDFDSF